jgi:hypothetical protein
MLSIRASMLRETPQVIGLTTPNLGSYRVGQPFPEKVF